MNLFSKSIDIIKKNQSKTGAYVASPNFETYNYSWFRDGAYIAYAMCVSGEFESARAFHMWCAKVMIRYSDVVKRVAKALANGETLNETQFLPTRFTLDGEAVDDEWTNFQTDGFGTWLWSLAEYIEKSNDKDFISEPDVAEGVKLCIEYLLAVWQEPCYDCWEEHLEYIHTYTVGSIYAGLTKIAEHYVEYTDTINVTAEKIKSYIEKNLIKNNQLIKMRSVEGVETQKTIGVDSSLLGLITPYNIFPVDTEVGKATIARIEKDIYIKDGGVYRYQEDTYFGGGEWILLTCWLGWCYVQAGQRKKAEAIVKWVEKSADEEGQLPEQVLDNVFDKDKLAEWEEMWGINAQPLLWSHAMYIILKASMDN